MFHRTKRILFGKLGLHSSPGCKSVTNGSKWESFQASHWHDSSFYFPCQAWFPKNRARRVDQSINIHWIWLLICWRSRMKLCFGALQQINVQMAEILAYQTENIWASASATSGGVVYRGAKYAGPEGLETHRRIQRLCPSIAYIHVLTCLNHQIPRFLMGNLRKDNCV